MWPAASNPFGYDFTPMVDDTMKLRGEEKKYSHHISTIWLPKQEGLNKDNSKDMLTWKWKYLKSSHPCQSTTTAGLGKLGPRDELSNWLSKTKLSDQKSYTYK